MTPDKAPDCSATRVRELLSYAPETGKFFWKVTASNRAPAGSRAGGYDS